MGSHISTQAIVLRETAYKDADKLLTILARGEGKMTVSAAGARRKTCRFSASAQLFAYSGMELFLYKDRASIREAELINAFLPLRNDLTALSAGAYAAEVCETLACEGEPSDDILDLAVFTFYSLSRHPERVKLIKAAFEIRIMAITGFEPALKEEGGALSHCVKCDLKRLFSFSLDEDDLNAFSAQSEKYLLYNIEKDFSSLDFYRSIL